MRTEHINRAAGRIRYRREIHYSIFSAIFQEGTKTKLKFLIGYSELILYMGFYINSFRMPSWFWSFWILKPFFKKVHCLRQCLLPEVWACAHASGFFICLLLAKLLIYLFISKRQGCDFNCQVHAEAALTAVPSEAAVFTGGISGRADVSMIAYDGVIYAWI